MSLQWQCEILKMKLPVGKRIKSPTGWVRHVNFTTDIAIGNVFRDNFFVQDDTKSIDVEAHNKLYSLTDDTNFEIGQHFKNKDELKNILLNEAIKISLKWR